MHRRRLLLTLLVCTLLLAQAAQAESLQEINLDDFLGGALQVENAWMLSPGVCVLLGRAPGEEDMAVALWNVDGAGPPALTALPGAASLQAQGREEGGMCMVLTPQDDAAPLIRVVIALNGEVSRYEVPAGITDMPGGQMAIREAADGSLYAVNRATGAEGLLLQGVPAPWDEPREGAAFRMYRQYVPAPDGEAGHDGTDGQGGPLSLSLPLDGGAFMDNAQWFIRSFHVYAPLDAQRFVYTVSGWEQGAGFGVYDLSTNTDHRITGRGFLYGLAGNLLFGSTLKADAATYETVPLPVLIQRQLYEVSAMEDGIVAYDLSADGTMLALTGMQNRYQDALSVTIADTAAGEVVMGYQIDNPHATAAGISFYDDFRVLVLYQSPEGFLTHLYLGDIRP